jgi:hypothetical protein
MFARILSLFALCGSVGASVSDCSKGGALFTLTSMSLTPDPPVLGQNSTLLLSMGVPEEINNGTAKYSYTYNFMPLSPTVDDLCDTTVACPIVVGTLDTRSSFPFDKALTGTLKVNIEWRDLTERLLLCVSLNLKLGDAAKQVAKRANSGWDHFHNITRSNRTVHH